MVDVFVPSPSREKVRLRGSGNISSDLILFATLHSLAFPLTQPSPRGEGFR